MLLRLRILLLFLLSTGLVRAQQESYFNKSDKNGLNRVFYGGLVAGMNACQIDGDTYSGFHKAGLNVGLVAYAKFSTKTTVSIELLYSQKGARNVQIINSVSVGTMPVIYTAKLNYAEIPVMINYAATNRIYFGAGLSYSRLISDKEYMDSYTSSSINSLENTFRKQDINSLLAVSYQLYNNIFVRVRYQYSVLSIRDASKIPIEFGTSRQLNNLFALQFICLF